jgi:integrase
MTNLVLQKDGGVEPAALVEKAKAVFDSLDVSETTRKDYATRITLFLGFVQKQDFHINSYIEFKRYLEKRTDYTVATKNKYLATAKVFLKEINRIGFLPADITQNVRLFSQNKKHKREGLTDAEMIRVVEEIKGLPDTPRNARTRALFCLLAFQGLRQIEILRLDVSDVDLVNKVALVRGKGSDDKEPVYLAPKTVEALRGYLRANKIGSGALFRSLGNRHSKRLSSMTIKREFKGVFDEAEVKKTVHGFRHFYITRLLQNLDVRDVRKFSRHRSLEMLIVYDDELDIRHKLTEVFACFESFNGL